LAIFGQNETYILHFLHPHLSKKRFHVTLIICIKETGSSLPAGQDKAKINCSNIGYVSVRAILVCLFQKVASKLQY